MYIVLNEYTVILETSKCVKVQKGRR